MKILPCRRLILCSTLLLCFSILPANSFAAPPPDHWVGTWAAAPTAANNVRRSPGSRAAATTTPAQPAAATATPPAPPTPAGPADNAGAAPSLGTQIYGAADTTLREIVHISLGGPMARVVFTNEFGAEPLIIGAAHVAVSEGGSSINLVTANALTFAGHPSITIPPGASAVSDPIAIKLPASADLAISLFLPAQPMKVASAHGFADQTSYTAPGNVVGGNARWPDVLARRLQSDKKTADIAVLNEGIGGNRILHDVSGPSALARFDRDVIAQAGVKYVIMLEGINDIGHSQDPVKPYDIVTAEDLIVGFTQLAERAHTHGIKFYAATILPYVGAKYASPGGEETRKAVNKWIRTTNLIDGFLDFDKTTQDPANPAMYLPAYDSGDHLHPKDAGYKAMGESIDLKLFAR